MQSQGALAEYSRPGSKGKLGLEWVWDVNQGEYSRLGSEGKYQQRINESTKDLI
uniref:Uncharacterized protein n=1 Tax=uncultured delta proteobacterium HF0070_07E19 TaxID=710823 RepID=E0XXB6_9DELT|nr:hypothetical protein [uncultured delta proteobacterium HF0070_07E19]